MRIDIAVPNESDAFIFASAAWRGRGISPGDREWTAAIERGDILPLAVESEDPANVRVLVDEPLAPAEQAEWVGVVRTGLRVPDGRLVAAGGIAYILEKAAWAEEDARVVEVPPGDYAATLYCYASAPNGRSCIEQAGAGEPPGAWCRRSHPGRELPAWLHNLCLHDPSLDPGRNAFWKRAQEKEGGAVVDFLLHLETARAPLVIPPCGADGVFSAGECRRPEPFPLGIPVAGAAGEEVSKSDAPAPPSAPAAKPAAAGELAAIPGGPVAVPVAKLFRVAHLAWFCQPYAQPALEITWPGAAPVWEEIEDATVRSTGSQMHITFADNGQPSGALQPLLAVAKQLAIAPDGTHIALSTARPRSKEKQGVHRYRGPVVGGVWQLTDASPAVPAAVLTEALALVETLENGRKFTARDEDEAARLEARITRVLADYFGGNPLTRTGPELALKRRDPALYTHVVARVFWQRYATTWPLRDEDAAR